MQLHWTVSFRASCLHAAEALAHGQLVVDPALAEAITEPAQELRKAISAAGLPRTQFWRNLVGLSVMVDGLSELAERAVAKTVGTTRAAAIARNLVASIAGIESAVRRAFPNLVDELTLRLPPLREQWDAHGPLLLQSIARWTDPRVVVPEAQVVLVHPALGGGGAAHIAYNNVHIEAVLTNPVPDLPENLRLAWLLAQLGLDLPAFSDQVHGVAAAGCRRTWPCCRSPCRRREDAELVDVQPRDGGSGADGVADSDTHRTWTPWTYCGAGGALIWKRGRGGISPSPRSIACSG